MTRFDVEEIKRDGVIHGLKSSIDARVHIVSTSFDKLVRQGKYSDLAVAMRQASAAIDEMRVLLEELKELEPGNN